METAWVVAGVLLVVATALPLSKSDRWWIRSFDFPRAQIALAIVAVIFGLAATGPRGVLGHGLLIALVAAGLYQTRMMWPYMPWARQQVQGSRRSADPASSLRLLTANVLMTNREAPRLLRIVREADADVILVVETDDWWRSQLADLGRTHPYTVLRPQGNTYGMLLYSRLELIDARVEFLVQDDIPSIHATVRLRSGVRVALHCLHPRPPFPTEDDSSTERDAELLQVGRRVKQHDAPVIVMGDLNDVAWSRTNNLFQDISGLLDPRIGRGFFNTFHAQIPVLRFPLDHFFHSNHFRLIAFKRLPRFGSDHFPVFIALSHEPQAPAEQPRLQADASQQREADEKIRQAR